MNATKLYFFILGQLAPKLAAKKMHAVMSNPKVRKLRHSEEAILQTADTSIHLFNGFNIQVYEWGNGHPKKIFLIHGWEGQAGNFSGLIDLLLAKNYHIITFDGPAHGKSTVKSTSMFEFADLVSDMIKIHEPDSIISHSFGSVTSVFGISRNPQVIIKQWFLITTPYNFKDRIESIKNQIGATDKTIEHLLTLVNNSTEHSIDELNMDFIGPKLHNAKSICIIHSKSDNVIPIDDSRRTHKAMPQSEFIALDNLGHYKILWSDAIKDILENRLN